ncbi:transcription termination factor, mitochondrial [Zerene cesonia]|uniref:transcription termination factor, mitochondrial n=1 Tax=Zerene cesonia TaxID=33412 RepID=UPI0018E56512|nr:transcription termination factor, mitochondrial [Zerene cesonia]
MFKSPVILFIKRSLFQLHSTVVPYRINVDTLKCDLLQRSLLSSTITYFKSEHTKAESTCDKSKLISKLNLQSEKHAEPFYKLPIKTLSIIYKTTKSDEKHGYCRNRLYYISSQIKCPPSLLSERIAKRSFIYTLSFEWIQSSLKVLLDMGVSPDRIVRDLWVLKYHHKTIAERLQKIKDLGIDPVYPWMVRCSDDILNRYIEIYQETKSILGNDKSVKVYIANRLNTKLEVVEEMYTKVPTLERIRVSKVKNFFDFLFSEGFTTEDIISKPRVLAASQKTVQERLEKLKSLGLEEINLNILCRSRKGFKKYYESLQSASREQ